MLPSPFGVQVPAEKLQSGGIICEMAPGGTASPSGVQLGLGGGGGGLVPLLNQFLGLEETTQVENLPGGQSDETAHGENAEVQNPGVCRF